MINKLLIKLGLRKPPEPDLPTLRAHDWGELEAERLRIRQRVHGPMYGMHLSSRPRPTIHTPPRPLPAPAPTHHYVRSTRDSARSEENFVSVAPSPAPAPRYYNELPAYPLPVWENLTPAPDEPVRSGGGGDFGGGGATGSWGDDSPSPSPSPSTD